MAKEKKQKGKIDMQAMMEIYQKAAAPGAPQKLLESMAGSWTTKNKGWMEPDKPPMETKGSSEQKMIFGGRYLQQDYSGDMMGMPFNGMGLMGYDNQTRKYVTAWIDSMSTGIFLFKGTVGRDGKTITQTCRFLDPVQGSMQYRFVTKIVDNNTFMAEMHSIGKKGKEMKMMEMTYTRKR
jgi:hypothetical protein